MHQPYGLHHSCLARMSYLQTAIEDVTKIMLNKEKQPRRALAKEDILFSLPRTTWTPIFQVRVKATDAEPVEKDTVDHMVIPKDATETS